MVLGIRTEDGQTDYLLLGLWSGVHEQALTNWAQTTEGLHEFTPDYHRLQLEYWIWQHHQKGHLAGRVVDIGVYDRRDWIGPGYSTFGERDADVVGDLTLLFPSDLGGEVDAIICTEVLEHCADPFQAMRRLHECLRPGGLLLVTSPFLWPDHGVAGEYKDYWRFLADGWRLLMTPFRDVQIIECAWSREGAAAYDTLRQWEGFGFRDSTRGSTGYLVSGRK